MFLIGSRALAIRAPHLLQNPPVDFDFISEKEEFENWRVANTKKYNLPEPEYTDRKIILREAKPPVECELIQEAYPSTIMFRDLVLEDKDTIETEFGLIPSLDMLFTLKQSHRYLGGPHFWKTVLTWNVLKKVGCEVRPEYQEFLKQREKETYIKKTPRLQGMKTSNFFTSNVKYQYIHDDLHLAMRHLERPAYEYYQPKDSEVNCSKEMFEACDEKVKLYGVLEEAYVLALERSVIPFSESLPRKKSFLIALEKVASTITGNWFREYAWLNLFKVLELYNDNYVDKFKEALARGEVRPYEVGA